MPTRPSPSAGNPLTRPRTSRGEGVVPSGRPAPTRRAVPRPAVPSSGRIDTDRRSAGSSRSLSQRVRGQSSSADLDAARRRLEAERARTRQPREITREDLLRRYSGDRSRAGRSGSEGRIITDVDASDARRRDAARRSIAGERPTAGTGQADRIEAARRDVARRDAGRAEAARDEATRRDANRRKEARRDAATVKRRPTKEQREAANERYTNRLKSAIGERRAGGRAGLPGDRVASRSPIETLPTGTLSTARPDRLSATGPTTNVGGAWRDRSGFACSGPDYYFNNCYWNTWGGFYGSPWGSWFCSPFFASGYWWHNCWYTGFYSWGLGWNGGFGWNGFGGRNAFWYGPSLPLATSIVYYDDPDPEVIYIEVPAEQPVAYADTAPTDGGYAVAGGAPVGSVGAAPAPAVGAQPAETDSGLQGELGRAASYYLTRGDSAFREARYGDAVHHYAKAVEFAPESGILYLVLSDALFATGDYRYAAFALRQAMEFDPELFENVVDKRDFYTDAADFDEQLELLEGYVDDHLLDIDARLVLASNYLYGGRPGAAIDLLQNPFSEELRGTDGAELLLRIAREALGFPPEAPEKGPQTIEIKGDDDGPL